MVKEKTKATPRRARSFKIKTNVARKKTAQGVKVESIPAITGGSYKIIDMRGKKMVHIPLEDYAVIVETLEQKEDAIAYDMGKQDTSDGFPSDIMRRIVMGEHPIKVIREWRGLTQKALAEEAGTKPAYVSQIETGKRGCSTTMLKNFADALNVMVDDLVE